MEVEEILKEIRKIRVNKGITLKSMSCQLNNKSVSTYCKKELGNIPITLEEYINICKILEKKPIYFFKSKLS